jgi:hypothetical protein
VFVLCRREVAGVPVVEVVPFRAEGVEYVGELELMGRCGA